MGDKIGRPPFQSSHRFWSFKGSGSEIILSSAQKCSVRSTISLSQTLGSSAQQRRQPSDFLNAFLTFKKRFFLDFDCQITHGMSQLNVIMGRRRAEQRPERRTKLQTMQLRAAENEPAAGFVTHYDSSYRKIQGEGLGQLAVLQLLQIFEGSKLLKSQERRD